MPISRNSARTDFNDSLCPSELSSILILVAGIILRIACAASGDRPALAARFPSTPLFMVHMASTTVIAHGPLQCASSEEELRRQSEWFAYSDDNPSDISRLVDLGPMPRFKDMKRSIPGLRSHVLGDGDMKIGVGLSPNE
jgi:hypothetical protein